MHVWKKFYLKALKLAEKRKPLQNTKRGFRITKGQRDPEIFRLQYWRNTERRTAAPMEKKLAGDATKLEIHVKGLGLGWSRQDRCWCQGSLYRWGEQGIRGVCYRGDCSGDRRNCWRRKAWKRVCRHHMSAWRSKKEGNLALIPCEDLGKENIFCWLKEIHEAHRVT